MRSVSEQVCQDRRTRNKCRTCTSSLARLRCVASEVSPAFLRGASPWVASLSLIKRSILASDFRIAFSSAGVPGAIPHSAYRLSSAVITSSIRLSNWVVSDSFKADAQASRQECRTRRIMTRIGPNILPQSRKKQATGKGTPCGTRLTNVRQHHNAGSLVQDEYTLDCSQFVTGR
jgi:hypothetical protein